MGEVTFLLLSLFRQNVTFVSVLSLDLSCSGKGEPLFGTGISLNLWHLLLNYGMNSLARSRQVGRTMAYNVVCVGFIALAPRYFCGVISF